MQSTIPGQKNIMRKGVDDMNGDVIKVGDKVRHTAYGRDAVVTSTHMASIGSVRFPEISIDQPGGPWAPDKVRKL